MPENKSNESWLDLNKLSTESDAFVSVDDLKADLSSALEELPNASSVRGQALATTFYTAGDTQNPGFQQIEESLLSLPPSRVSRRYAPIKDGEFNASRPPDPMFINAAARKSDETGDKFLYPQPVARPESLEGLARQKQANEPAVDSASSAFFNDEADMPMDPRAMAFAKFRGAKISQDRPASFSLSNAVAEGSAEQDADLIAQARTLSSDSVPILVERIAEPSPQASQVSAPSLETDLPPSVKSVMDKRRKEAENATKAAAKNAPPPQSPRPQEGKANGSPGVDLEELIGPNRPRGAAQTPPKPSAPESEASTEPTESESDSSDVKKNSEAPLDVEQAAESGLFGNSLLEGVDLAVESSLFSSSALDAVSREAAYSAEDVDAFFDMALNQLSQEDDTLGSIETSEASTAVFPAFESDEAIELLSASASSENLSEEGFSFAKENEEALADGLSSEPEEAVSNLQTDAMEAAPVVAGLETPIATDAAERPVDAPQDALSAENAASSAPDVPGAELEIRAEALDLEGTPLSADIEQSASESASALMEQAPETFSGDLAQQAAAESSVQIESAVSGDTEGVSFGSIDMADGAAQDTDASGILSADEAISAAQALGEASLSTASASASVPGMQNEQAGPTATETGNPPADQGQKASASFSVAADSRSQAVTSEIAEKTPQSDSRAAVFFPDGELNSDSPDSSPQSERLVSTQGKEDSASKADANQELGLSERIGAPGLDFDAQDAAPSGVTLVVDGSSEATTLSESPLQTAPASPTEIEQGDLSFSGSDNAPSDQESGLPASVSVVAGTLPQETAGEFAERALQDDSSTAVLSSDSESNAGSPGEALQAQSYTAPLEANASPDANPPESRASEEKEDSTSKADSTKKLGLSEQIGASDATSGLDAISSTAPQDASSPSGSSVASGLSLSAPNVESGESAIATSVTAGSATGFPALESAESASFDVALSENSLKRPVGGPADRPAVSSADASAPKGTDSGSPASPLRNIITSTGRFINRLAGTFRRDSAESASTSNAANNATDNAASNATVNADLPPRTRGAAAAKTEESAVSVALRPAPAAETVAPQPLTSEQAIRMESLPVDAAAAARVDTAEFVDLAGVDASPLSVTETSRALGAARDTLDFTGQDDGRAVDEARRQNPDPAASSEPVIAREVSPSIGPKDIEAGSDVLAGLPVMQGDEIAVQEARIETATSPAVLLQGAPDPVESPAALEDLDVETASATGSGARLEVSLRSETPSRDEERNDTARGVFPESPEEGATLAETILATTAAAISSSPFSQESMSENTASVAAPNAVDSAAQSPSPSRSQSSRADRGAVNDPNMGLGDAEDGSASGPTRTSFENVRSDAPPMAPQDKAQPSSAVLGTSESTALAPAAGEVGVSEALARATEPGEIADSDRLEASLVTNTPAESLRFAQGKDFEQGILSEDLAAASVDRQIDTIKQPDQGVPSSTSPAEATVSEINLISQGVSPSGGTLSETTLATDPALSFESQDRQISSVPLSLRDAAPFPADAPQGLRNDRILPQETGSADSLAQRGASASDRNIGSQDATAPQGIEIPKPLSAPDSSRQQSAASKQPGVNSDNSSVDLPAESPFEVSTESASPIVAYDESVMFTERSSTVQETPLQTITGTAFSFQSAPDAAALATVFDDLDAVTEAQFSLQREPPARSEALTRGGDPGDTDTAIVSVVAEAPALTERDSAAPQIIFRSEEPITEPLAAEPEAIETFLETKLSTTAVSAPFSPLVQDRASGSMTSADTPTDAGSIAPSPSRLLPNRADTKSGDSLEDSPNMGPGDTEKGTEARQISVSVEKAVRMDAAFMTAESNAQPGGTNPRISENTTFAPAADRLDATEMFARATAPGEAIDSDLLESPLATNATAVPLRSVQDQAPDQVLMQAPQQLSEQAPNSADQPADSLERQADTTRQAERGIPSSTSLAEASVPELNVFDQVAGPAGRPLPEASLTTSPASPTSSQDSNIANTPLSAPETMTATTDAFKSGRGDRVLSKDAGNREASSPRNASAVDRSRTPQDMAPSQGNKSFGAASVSGSLRQQAAGIGQQAAGIGQSALAAEQSSDLAVSSDTSLGLSLDAFETLTDIVSAPSPEPSSENGTAPVVYGESPLSTESASRMAEEAAGDVYDLIVASAAAANERAAKTARVDGNAAPDSPAVSKEASVNLADVLASGARTVEPAAPSAVVSDVPFEAPLYMDEALDQVDRGLLESARLFDRQLETRLVAPPSMEVVQEQPIAMRSDAQTASGVAALSSLGARAATADGSFSEDVTLPIISDPKAQGRAESYGRGIDDAGYAYAESLSLADAFQYPSQQSDSLAEVAVTVYTGNDNNTGRISPLGTQLDASGTDVVPRPPSSDSAPQKARRQSRPNEQSIRTETVYRLQEETIEGRASSRQAPSSQDSSISRAAQTEESVDLASMSMEERLEVMIRRERVRIENEYNTKEDNSKIALRRAESRIREGVSRALPPRVEAKESPRRSSRFQAAENSYAAPETSLNNNSANPFRSEERERQVLRTSNDPKEQLVTIRDVEYLREQQQVDEVLLRQQIKRELRLETEERIAKSNAEQEIKMKRKMRSMIDKFLNS